MGRYSGSHSAAQSMTFGPNSSRMRSGGYGSHSSYDKPNYPFCNPCFYRDCLICTIGVGMLYGTYRGISFLYNRYKIRKEQK